MHCESDQGGSGYTACEGLSLGCDTNSPEFFRGFSQSFQANAKTVPQMLPHPFQFTVH